MTTRTYSPMYQRIGRALRSISWIAHRATLKSKWSAL